MLALVPLGNVNRLEVGKVSNLSDSCLSIKWRPQRDNNAYIANEGQHRCILSCQCYLLWGVGVGWGGGGWGGNMMFFLLIFNELGIILIHLDAVGYFLMFNSAGTCFFRKQKALAAC